MPTSASHFPVSYYSGRAGPGVTMQRPRESFKRVSRASPWCYRSADVGAYNGCTGFGTCREGMAECLGCTIMVTL